MTREEAQKLIKGDTVTPVIGPWKGQACVVEKTEFDSGARNSWITVILPNGSRGLYAGEEVCHD